MTYGKAPEDLGEVNLHLPEVMYYLYLPLKLAGQPVINHFPDNLKGIKGIADILLKIYYDIGREAWVDNNIYITIKKMFVSPSVTANRPGWHADGFGTDDLNYVWYDCLPTEFSVGSNFKITEGDHIKSLEEFESQAHKNPLMIYPNTHLLKLDPYVVHRVAMAKEQMMRTFIKVSVSKDEYNLKDNSINHGMNYKWERYDRDMVRNNPATAQKDSYKPTPVDDHLV